MKIFGLEINRIKASSYGTMESTLANPAAWHLLAWTGSESTAGVVVSPESSMQLTAVQSCVRVLAESVAGLPLITYRRTPDGGKMRATTHPLYRLLHDQPNDEMTAYVWRETMVANLMLWGNAYAQIVRDAGGRVAALNPLPSYLVTPKRNAVGAIVYEVRIPDESEPRVFSALQMLHVPGLGFDGLVGKSPIAWARDAVGTSIASEQFACNYFRTGGLPKDILEYDKTLDAEATEMLRKSWSASHGTTATANTTAILPLGIKHHVVTALPLRDAQFVELRQYQASDIARIYRIPPHMIGEMGRATWGNAEVMDVSFVKHTLRPWLVRIEQALAWKLLTPAERDSYYFEHLVDALLRGDIKSRYDAYAVGRQWGWLSINDVRKLENMDPVEDGDEYLQPLNMSVVGGEPAAPSTAAAPPATAPAAAAVVLDPVIAAVCERIIAREHADIERQRAKRAMQDDPDAMAAWLVDYYAGEHAGWIAQQCAPVLQAAGRDEGLAGTVAGNWRELALLSYLDGLPPTAAQLRGVIDEVIA